MNPVLFAAAQRLAPLLQRLGARVGTFGPPTLMQRYMSGGPTPQVNAQPVPPSNGPSPPISTDNSGGASQPNGNIVSQDFNALTPTMSPNGRVAQGFDVFNPYMPPRSPVPMPQPRPQVPAGGGFAGPHSVGGAPINPVSNGGYNNIDAQAGPQPTRGPDLIQAMISLLKGKADQSSSMGTTYGGDTSMTPNPYQNTFS